MLAIVRRRSRKPWGCPLGDEVVQTPFGKFLIDPQDLIGSTLKAGTLWDGPGFLEVIAKEYGQLGDQGVTILDVGANLGAFTIWLASQGAWRVVAVEPVPQTILRLKANLDLNQAICADTVVLLEIAAYDHGCRMRVDAYDPTNPGGASVVPDPEGGIQAAPLDDFRFLWEGGLSLVKIDAQGCDGRVLRGLQQSIAIYRPTIVFEWDATLAKVHGDELADTLAWLDRRAYEVHPWPTHPDNYLALPRSRPCA